nr:MFS transporter [Natronospira proteinivora]
MTAPAVIALVIAMGLVGVSFGASAPLVASILEERGFSEYYTGAVSATLSLAIALLSPFAGNLVVRLGPRWITLAGILLQGLCFSALGLALFWAEYLLFPVRFLLGLAAALTFVAAETALLRGVRPHLRGRAMAAYGTIMGLGYGGGVLLSAPAYAWLGLWCFGLVGLLAVVVAPICRWGLRSLPRPQPATDSSRRRGRFMRWRLVIIGLYGAIIFGVLDNGMTGIYPVEGLRLGFDRSQTLNIVGVMLIASVLAQPLCGVLADRIGARRVLAALALTGLAGAGLTGWIAWQGLGYVPTLLGFAVIGLAGGGTYPVCLKMIGDRVRSEALPKANAAFSAAYGWASLLGPLAGAVMIDGAIRAGLLGWALPGLALVIFVFLLPLILLDRHWHR